MKKAIQITIDEALLRRIDRDPEARRRGRSAFLRKAADEYLRRKREREIDESYRRGYGKAPASREELGPWGEGLSWPDE